MLDSILLEHLLDEFVVRLSLKSGEFMTKNHRAVAAAARSSATSTEIDPYQSFKVK